MKYGDKMKRNSQTNENDPLVMNGWTLIHNVPLSIRVRDYMVKRNIYDLSSDEKEVYI